MNCAMFISANNQYLPYLNALLNSIEKRKLFNRQPFDVIILYDNSISKQYIDECNKFNYNIKFTVINDKEVGLDTSWSSAWKCKAGRYYYLQTIGKQYDVCCLMDADLYIVTDQFVDFFNLVYGTKNLIGCNERIKWQISDIYTLNGIPILEKPTRLDKFHCNVPLFLDAKQWDNVFSDYLKIVYRGCETRNNDKKPIGDLYSWNIAVYRQNRQDDVILLSMPVMTQVHRTGYRDKNCAINITNDDYWTNGDGDQIYTIHARPDKPGFKNIDLKNEYKKHNIDPNIYNKYVKFVEREWIDLNFNCVIDIRKYQNNPYWDNMAKY